MALNTTLKLGRITDKPLKWEIIKNPMLYRDQKYEISFRLIILHALKYYFGNNPFDPKPTSQLLTELKNAATVNSPGFYEKKFMELYTFDKKGEQGLVLIDRSYGCFALILYPDDNNPDHGFRIGGLIKALDDLILNHETYDNLLKSESAWDPHLVDQLRAIFKFSESETRSDF